MLDQELASIIHTVLAAADNPTPLYHNVPEGFAVPSVFFPVPEQFGGSSSLSSYEISYMWFIKFFASESADAYSMASNVLEHIVSRRNAIPLYDTEGELIGKSMRIGYPRIRKIEDGVVQMQIEWNSIRPYYEETEPIKATSFDANISFKNNNPEAALLLAVEQYQI